MNIWQLIFITRPVTVLVMTILLTWSICYGYYHLRRTKLIAGEKGMEELKAFGPVMTGVVIVLFGYLASLILMLDSYSNRGGPRVRDPKVCWHEFVHGFDGPPPTRPFFDLFVGTGLTFVIFFATRALGQWLAKDRHMRDQVGL